uniref:Uncharacterized protein n=1 Tax=uncultured marine virus TaxID=186617 RepID=A0A0F7L7X9_9VIRU|nr:hypothetical protein [uncultured marine virus]
MVGAWGGLGVTEEVQQEVKVCGCHQRPRGMERLKSIVTRNQPSPMTSGGEVRRTPVQRAPDGGWCHRSSISTNCRRLACIRAWLRPSLSAL